MKRGCGFAVAGAAIVLAGVSGCMLNKPLNRSASSSTSSSSSSPATTSSWTGGQTRVVIDGQDQGVTKNADCTMMSGRIKITISGGSTGIYVIDLTDGNPPDVDSANLDNSKYHLDYTHGIQGSAEAHKKGSAFVISGTATGTAGSNPDEVSKPFEIDAVCSSGGSPGTSSASAGGQTKVIIDGQNQGVTGDVSCIMVSGTIDITIKADPASYDVELTDGNPLVVDNVSLDNPKNGLSLDYTGEDHGNAQATRDGNTFKIAGTASGTVGSNPGEVSKPFEIDVACTTS